jgi:hypothetical protein
VIRRKECTICTAIAPDAVLIVRTYDTLERRLSAHIRRSETVEPQVTASIPGTTGNREPRQEVGDLLDLCTDR